MPNEKLPENWKRTSGCTYEYTLNGQTIADVQDSGQGHHILHIRIKPMNGIDRSWAIETSTAIASITVKDLLEHATDAIRDTIAQVVDQLDAFLPDPIEEEIRLHATSLLAASPGVADRITDGMYKEMARTFKDGHSNLISDDTQYDDVIWSYVTQHGLIE